MKQFIIGAVAVAIGMSMVIKTDGYLQNVGGMRWAEEKLAGGSKSGYKLMGSVIVILGLLAVTGMLGGITGGLLTKLFGAN